MSYSVRRYSKNAIDFFPATSDEFYKARSCKNTLITLVGIEEKFNLMIENYAELERELLSITFEKALTFGGSWSEGADVRQLINRRLINLLSTCRLYRDQVSHDLSSIYGKKSGVAAAFEKQTNTEYDLRPGYRFMEELRNHVLHRGLPVHLITFSGRRLKDGDGSRRRHITKVELSVARLRNAGGFKKEILHELESQGENVDLKHSIREYVTGWFGVQKCLREQSEPLVESTDQLSQEIVDGLQQTFGNNESSYSYVSMNESEEIIEEEVLSLFEILIERRRALARKNSYAGELTTLTISNE